MQWLIPDARLAMLDVRTSVPDHAARGNRRASSTHSSRNPEPPARPNAAARTPPFRSSGEPHERPRDRPHAVGMRRAAFHRPDPRARPRHCAHSRRSSTAIACGYTYTTLGERVHRLASARSTRWASSPGATVAMMDWDSHRYLECFFAVPMMGAVLHTVNVRISPEQVLYTINHAADDVILVNAEFLPLLEAIHAKIRPGVKLVLINDGAATPRTTSAVRRRIRVDARARRAVVRLPGSRREHAARRRSTRPARPGCRRASTTATASSCCTRWPWRRRSRTRRTRRSPRATSTCRSRRCSTCMRGACRTLRRCSASSRSIRGATCRTCCSD